MAEIARAHPRSDYQVIELDLANPDSRARCVYRARTKVHACHVGEHHTNILLLVGDLSYRGGDLGRRKNRRCYLIEQRLENVVIAPVDQNDIRIASFQSTSRGDPGESASDDHNTLAPRNAFASWLPRTYIGWTPIILHRLTHCSPSLLTD